MALILLIIFIFGLFYQWKYNSKEQLQVNNKQLLDSPASSKNETGESGQLSDDRAVPPLSDSCVSQPDGQPVITSMSSDSGPIGTILEIKGCNLSGFEGDLDVYFEDEKGEKIMLSDNFGSYAKTQDTLLKVTVKEPCQKGETVTGRYSGIETECDFVQMKSGVYKVYVEPWGKKSNIATFVVTPE